MLRIIYLWLIRLHPPYFRKRFADEMLFIFDQESGWLAAFGMVTDGARSLLRQWTVRHEFWKEPDLKVASEIGPSFRTLQRAEPTKSTWFKGIALSASVFCVFWLAIVFGQNEIPQAGPVIIQQYGLAVLSTKFDPNNFQSGPDVPVAADMLTSRPRAQDQVLVQAPADHGLFQAPAGYTVKDVDAEGGRANRPTALSSGGAEAETLAGPWEADDPIAGKPAQMGILLKIGASRRVALDGRKVTWDGPPRINQMDIRVYRRNGGETKGGWLSARGQPGSVFWDGHRLQLNFKGSGPNSFVQGPLGFDLTFDEQGQGWTGSYTYSGATKPIRLVRPGTSPTPSSNAFVGGWSESRPGSWRCVNILQAADGTLMAWRDSRTGPNVIPRPPVTSGSFEENDGDSLGAEIKGDTLTLQEGIYWAVITGPPPRKFTGKLSSNGTQIVGTWGPISSPTPGERELVREQSATFTKVTGQSCWSQNPN